MATKKKKSTKPKLAPELPDFDMTPLYSADSKSLRRRLGTKTLEEVLLHCGHNIDYLRAVVRELHAENDDLHQRLTKIDALIHFVPAAAVPPVEADTVLAQEFGVH
jgi:hypothetical protein